MRKTIAILTGLCLAGVALAETDYPSKPRFVKAETRLTALEAQTAVAAYALSGSASYAVAVGSATNGETITFSPVFRATPTILVQSPIGTNNAYAASASSTSFVVRATAGTTGFRYLAVGLK